MRTVFALRGKSNLGKSQTIRTVVEMLTAKYPDAAIEHDHTTRVDARVVLTIDGFKIGIESQGDAISGSLDLFVRIGCDLIICATRTRGTAVDAVKALEGFDVKWFEQPAKSKPHEQVLRSLIMARTLVERVEALIASTKPAPARTFSATA